MVELFAVREEMVELFANSGDPDQTPRNEMKSKRHTIRN